MGVAPWTSFTTEKVPNLKWKIWPKQLLGYLPLAFALPCLIAMNVLNSNITFQRPRKGYGTLMKLNLSGGNLGWVFNSKRCHMSWSSRKKPELSFQVKVENLAQTTFRLSPVSFCASLPDCHECATLKCHIPKAKERVWCFIETWSNRMKPRLSFQLSKMCGITLQCYQNGPTK